MVQQPDTSSLDSNEYEYDSDRQLKCMDSSASHADNALVFQQNNQEEKVPTFGNISVTNGTDIHFGNKTFYQGPVTIQQFLYGTDKKTKKIDDSDISPSAIRKIDISDIDNNCKTGLDNLGCDEAVAVIKNGDIEGSRADRKCVDQRTDKDEFFTENPLKTFLFKSRITAASAFGLVLILSVLAVVLPLVLRTNAEFIENVSEVSRTQDDEHDHNTPIKAPTDPANTLKPLKLKIVSRLEWLAQPPSQPVDTLDTPVPYVIISHTATENCSSQAQCVFQVRYIQTFHMESRGWWDIGYNFLVGGDGEVYHGRGWDKVGSHTYGYNVKSIGISFIGTFISSKPPEYQLIACKDLIQKGVELGYIKKDYKLLGARQLQTTKSPGEELYKEIQTWPHWVESP